MPFRSEAFGPDVLKAMSAAYDKACGTIQAGPHSELANEILAKHIIKLADQGITDPDMLCTEILKVFGFERIPIEGGGPPVIPTAH